MALNLIWGAEEDPTAARMDQMSQSELPGALREDSSLVFIVFPDHRTEFVFADVAALTIERYGIGIVFGDGEGESLKATAAQICGAGGEQETGQTPVAIFLRDADLRHVTDIAAHAGAE